MQKPSCHGRRQVGASGATSRAEQKAQERAWKKGLRGGEATKEREQERERRENLQWQAYAEQGASAGK